MSMNFLEGLGYVAQGAIEKDDEIRKEKLSLINHQQKVQK